MRALRPRRSLVALGALQAALALSPAPARAEVTGKSWDFSVNMGGIFLGRNIGRDNLFGTLRGGYNFTPWIELEGSWEFVRTESSANSNLSSNLDLYGFDLLYHFTPDNPVVPYVFGGAGVIRVELERVGGETDRNTDLFWEGGGGVKIPVHKWIDVRFDVRIQRYRLERDVAPPAPLNGTLADERFRNRAFTIGAGFHFPATHIKKVRKPAAPKAPAPAPAPAPPTPAPPQPAPPPPSAPAPAPEPQPAPAPTPQPAPSPAPPPSPGPPPEPAPPPAPAPQPPPQTAPEPPPPSAPPS